MTTPMPRVCRAIRWRGEDSRDGPQCGVGSLLRLVEDQRMLVPRYPSAVRWEGAGVEEMGDPGLCGGRVGPALSVPPGRVVAR